MHKVPPFDYELQLPEAVKKVAKRLRYMAKRRGLLFFPELPKKLSFAPMSVNDICVTMPAWFGSLQSLFGGLLTYEATFSVNAAICAVGVMAFIPANLMRSVAGEFDNEAVAVSAILSTFWLWVRSVRTPRSWPIAIPAGLSYIFIVATWGGYIFVLNTIGLHALMLVGLGRFNSGVHKAYTLFVVVGTAGAVQIPVVGWTPLRSLEQIGPLGVFLGYQVLAFCDFKRRSRQMPVRDFVVFRIQTFAVLVILLAAIACILTPMGYFGPLSSRIRGLFVQHTRTGNPLVDSVAEHQPANASMFSSYLNLPLDFVSLGAWVCLFNRTNGSYFLALYGYIAMHFSLKMNRLILICGPITAIVCGIWVGFMVDFIIEPFLLILGKRYPADTGVLATSTSSVEQEAVADSAAKGKENASKGKKGKPEKNERNQRSIEKSQKPKNRLNSEHEWGLAEWEEECRPGGIAQLKRTAKINIINSLSEEVWIGFGQARETWREGKVTHRCRVVLSIGLLFHLLFVSNLGQRISTFMAHCDATAYRMSNPTVMKLIQGPDGRTVIDDDPWQGYKWLARETPKDARVFAWWDYGYQITGIGKRTSLADGNTWNHEHIATLGRLLSGSQKSSHSVIRHLADYVLIMTGGVNDDLGIATHFARIGNSVFPDHCGDEDPYCQKFSFHHGSRHQPSEMMSRSLVYNLYMHGKGTTAGADPKLFELVWKSPRDELRFFKVLNVSQESKNYVANASNRICDAPGSWYCVGQYPPALKKFLKKRSSFAQVEDFNKKGQKSAYTKMIEKEKQRGGDL